MSQSLPISRGPTAFIQNHFLVAAILITLLGVGVRIATFKLSTPIRVAAGINHAWTKGSEALNRGPYFDGIVAEYDPASKTDIDYPPIRMYIKTAWVFYTRSQGLAPAETNVAPTRFDSILWPMLTVNALLEFAAACFLFALCRLRYSQSASLLAACLLWFNPALLLNSFCWTQWDVWPLAPLLAATYFLLHPTALKKPWPHALAGLSFAIAFCLKGQSLFATPAILTLCILRPFLYANPTAPLSKKILATLTQLAALLTAIALTVFLITLPFTLHGSIHWLDIYTMQFHRPLPLFIDAWNLPYALQQLLHATPDTQILPHLTLVTTLKLSFVIWTVYVCSMAIRSRETTTALASPGLLFAAMFAIMPCMYERYALWSAALLIPLLLRSSLRPLTILAYSLVNLVALLCPLDYCLRQNPATLPNLKATLDWLSPTLGLLYFAAALLLSLSLLPRSVKPQPSSQSASPH